MNINNSPQTRSKLFWGITGFSLVPLLGLIDYLTGYEVSFSLFYLAPISLITWFIGKRWGLVISTFSAITWLIADLSSGLLYTNSIIYLWNTMIRFGFFITVTLLISALKKELSNEQELTRVDYVSEAVSVRYFYELAQKEINRSQRYGHPLTFAYIDIDNFKGINDQYGHSVGDKVLRTLVSTIKRQIRNTDTIARLGGDEFILVLPETDQEQARALIPRINQSLADEKLHPTWSVTVSIGVVTYTDFTKSVDDMVKIADKVMYAVKLKGKDGVGYTVFPVNS
jgi:diguanylate cyclase (GGDEF)-like protein